MTFDRPGYAELKTFLARPPLPKLLCAVAREDLHAPALRSPTPAALWAAACNFKQNSYTTSFVGRVMGINLALPAGVGRRHKDCYILDRESTIHAESHRHLKSAGLQTCPGRDEAGAKFPAIAPGIGAANIEGLYDV